VIRKRYHAKHHNSQFILVKFNPDSILLILCSIIVFLSMGCAQKPPLNIPLKRFDLQQGYRITNPRCTPDNDDELLVILAFSGGGTRAAALSYGVMQQLKHTQITVNEQTRPLTDEIDIISSVSGGSFTSAYFALFGDELFDSYEQNFLKGKVRKHLLERLFALDSILRLLFGEAQRTDIAYEYYNENIFRNHTFEDLLQHNAGPFIIINATDITLGLPFEFTQDQFDLLYSDLSGFPVAAAVTASSAFPIAFNPITLKNYPKPLPPDFQTPQWIEEDLQLRRSAPRRFRKAQQAASYIDHCRRQYIHLIDGGVADNLGVYSILNTLNSPCSPWDIEKLGNVKKIIAIVVNAQNDPDRKWDKTPKAPTVFNVASASIHGFMDNFTFETVSLLEQKIKEVSQISGLKNEEDIESYLIEINFDYIENEAFRRYFDNIATDLMLPEDQVDCLMFIGAWLLRNSEEFRQLVEDLNGSIQPVKHTLPEHVCHLCDDEKLPPPF